VADAAARLARFNTGDELGWHERTAAHFAGFAKNQNTSPIPETIPPADEQFNLARSEAAIHSNGDMSKNHYDMNLVAVDAFFRHLLWTGDTNYAREMWPVIERHLAWERRLFRREFGPDKLPLYEAYAAIWASDDLNYNGGGTAHASAYNYFANTMAARVAKILGEDPTIYEQRSGFDFARHEQISLARGRRKFCREQGFARPATVHPNSGLWTFYHTIDSEVPTPRRRGRCRAGLTTHIAHIPDSRRECAGRKSFHAAGDQLDAVSMVAQQRRHGRGRAHVARLLAGEPARNRVPAVQRRTARLDVLGLCPGNVGCMTSHDMARGEAQRDFADAIGVNSRALVEGLFGIKPDALAGELKIVPGFPAKWDHASIHHPDFNFEFRRDGLTETYLVEPKFPKPMELNLQFARCEPRRKSPSTENRRNGTGLKTCLACGGLKSKVRRRKNLRSS
jgi:hypothetical protein